MLSDAGPGAEPDRIGIAEPGLTLIDTAEPTRQAWREELAQLGGPSPLVHVPDSIRTRIDLTSSHPGGLARFIAGKKTRLSALIRESFAWRTAQLAADAIVTKASELSSARGIDAVRLGIVIAEWEVTRDGQREQFAAPVLLAPLSMRRLGEDFEVQLRGRIILNPEFAEAMARDFGVRLDPELFPALAYSEDGFTPNAVLDRLRGLTAHIEGFRTSPRLLVTSFAEVARAMTADAAQLAHPVLDALAGNESAAASLRAGFQDVEPVDADRRSPQTDSLLLDADAEQEHIIARIAAGNSLVVRTLPGTGGTQTIVNAIGALVGDGKRVLVVGSRRASVRAIRERLDAVGLPGLVASPRTARRDTVMAISRSEKAKKPELDEVSDALVRLRSVVRDYRDALVRTDPVLGVSVLDCVSELSAIAIARPDAETTARLSRESVEALWNPEERARITTVMMAASRFGEFKHAPGISPWYGAQFANSEAAGRAHQIAVRLHESALSDLLERGTRLIAGTHMRPFENIAELGIYVRLLLDLRDTLDRFQPAVFDRSISELVAATAPRREHPEMSGSDRRRLRKLAEEYLRPGVRVPDLHDSLVRIQQQRVLWHRYVAEGATPRVPVGIAEVQVALQAVEQDLAELDGPLGRTGADRLSLLPLAELQRVVGGLASDADALHNLQERTALMTTLHEAGLDPLVKDFAERGVAPERMGAELELAWWKSALAGMLETERALLGANTSVLDRLESDFRLVDAAHAKGNAASLAWRLAEQWSLGLADWPEEASALKRVLRRDHVTHFDLQTAAPHLVRSLNPVWVASTYEVPEISATTPFDTVILVDAGATTVAENVPAIRRGRQVVAFGDPVTQTPSAFETMVTERRPGDPVRVTEDLHDRSALAALSAVLRTFTLTRSYRAGGEDLASLVNRRFYSGRIVSQPWAGTWRGQASLVLEQVEDGSGQLNAANSAVESPTHEVARVVDLVLEHARRRPHESLMVITACAKHATRVMDAVLAAVATRPELVDFVAGLGDEPFDVLALEHSIATSRDHVIFSLGYGRTPHGRVLGDFGPLSTPGGDRLLASALASARQTLTVVTAVGAEDLTPWRGAGGVGAFADVLVDIARPVPVTDRDGDADPMLVDLAARLRQRGLTTRLGYRGELPLAVGFSAACAVVESDSDILEGSLRESLRMRPALLERLGWRYVRVHAFELFQDPEGVADRIAEMLGVSKPEPTVAEVAESQPTMPMPALPSRAPLPSVTATLPPASQWPTASAPIVEPRTEPLDAIWIPEHVGESDRTISEAVVEAPEAVVEAAADPVEVAESVEAAQIAGPTTEQPTLQGMGETAEHTVVVDRTRGISGAPALPAPSAAVEPATEPLTQLPGFEDDDWS